MDSKKENRLFNEKVGLNLYRLLEKNGTTQEQFAEMMGVSPRTIAYWLSGQKLPNAYTLDKASKLFGATLGDLVA
jgi:transcriptional regulator with XRE-family HTH domain